MNARVNQYLSIPCGGAVHSVFKWIRYFTSAKRPQKLYESWKIRNNTYTSIVFLSNGTMIFPSAQEYDTAEYHCIIDTHNDTDTSRHPNLDDEFVYRVNIQSKNHDDHIYHCLSDNYN